MSSFSGSDALPRLAPSPRRRVERCEFCGAPMPAKHSHVIDIEEPAADVLVPPLLPAVHQSRGRRRQVPLGRRALPARARIGRSHWEMLDIPVGMAFFIQDCRAEPRVGLLPQPRGRHRIRPLRSIRGRRCARQSVAREHGARHRGAAGLHRRRAPGIVDRAGGRLLRTGRPYPAALERLRRRRKAALEIDAFFATPRRNANRRARARPELRHYVRAAPEPHAAVAHAEFPAAHLRGRRRAGTRGAAARPDADSAAAPQVFARRAGALGDLFGDAGRWRDTLRPLLWTQAFADGPALRPARRNRPARRLHLRSRSDRRQNICTRSMAAKSRCCSSSAAPCSRKRKADFASNRFRGKRRPPSACP